jgi:predicted type IV restriction endonuclease
LRIAKIVEAQFGGILQILFTVFHAENYSNLEDSMNEPLEKALVKAREKLLSGVLSEAQVSQGPVRSILQALGWDTFDVDCVVPEYTVGSRRVDYALKANPATTDVFLEIKAPGKADDAADQQLFEYAFHVGVPFAVLTDGRVWNFYLPSGQGNYQDRRLFKLDIVERELSEACERLRRYLGFERTKRGLARAEAVKEYEDGFQKSKVKALIPKVWQDLLAGPDDLLCDVLIEAVEAEGGQRPLRDDVAAYLQSVSGTVALSKSLPGPAKSYKPATSGTVKQPVIGHSSVLSQVGKGIGFQIPPADWQPFTNGKQCYVAIIRHLVSNYPEFPTRFQNAKTRGKRAWISKTREQLFPGRTDFQESEVTPVGEGWLVGTQMSAQVEMTKRVEAACACVGFVFGRDVLAVFF